MNNNFELFRCCLGNGVTVCNKAVTVDGDYKIIAHINNAGVIKLYVSEGYIPLEAMEIIKADAERLRKTFIDYWNGCTTAYKYEKILDSLPCGKMVEVIKAKKPMAVTVEELTSYYMENY